ncbi:hypothetical protein F5Y13DRAFT_189911 [Hypoxylon sp. FL1857]|nr:hypothetical protein F5Y13DRAFT_189911 [Hypoxylon sp. FL1857]
MPFTPEENHAAGSSKAVGKSTTGHSRKRARTDSGEAPRAKTPRTDHGDKHEQLEQNLETALVKLQDALAELQKTKDDIRDYKARINNLIEELQDIRVIVSTSTMVHDNIRTEERLQRENANLRERIKELEDAADNNWNGIDDVPLQGRRTGPSSPLSNADDRIMVEGLGGL